jgi:8-oxo-dGTP pyrophosphatase MutT (NUDIX family)
MAGLDHDAVDTALRELREETGIIVERDAAEFLQIIHADTGVLRDSVAIVSVQVSRDDVVSDPGSGTTADGETTGDGTVGKGITDWELSNMRWVPAGTMETMIAAGEIRDGITLAAWCIQQARGRRAHGA